jgi:hypothetical protein
VSIETFKLTSMSDFITLNYIEQLEFERAQVADVDNDALAESIALEDAMKILRNFKVSIREMPPPTDEALWRELEKDYGFTKAQANALKQQLADIAAS